MVLLKDGGGDELEVFFASWKSSRFQRNATVKREGERGLESPPMTALSALFIRKHFTDITQQQIPLESDRLASLRLGNGEGEGILPN